MNRDIATLTELYFKIQSQMLNEHKDLMIEAITALVESKKDNAQKAMDKLTELIRVALKENGISDEEYKMIVKLQESTEWQYALKNLIKKGIKHD